MVGDNRSGLVVKEDKNTGEVCERDPCVGVACQVRSKVIHDARMTDLLADTILDLSQSEQVIRAMRNVQ